MVLSTTAPSLVLASFSLILCVGCVLCYIRVHLATRQRIWSLPHYFRRVLGFPSSIRLPSHRRGSLLFSSCFSRRPSSPCVSLQFCCRCKFSAYWTFSLCCDLFRGDCCTRAFFPGFLWFWFSCQFGWTYIARVHSSFLCAFSLYVSLGQLSIWKFVRIVYITSWHTCFFVISRFFLLPSVLLRYLSSFQVRNSTPYYRSPLLSFQCLVFYL